MSEGILRALMQLFAVVVFSSGELLSRRAIVKAFLMRHLNSHQTDEYLELFDEFYRQHESRLSDRGRFHRRVSVSSVKTLRIAMAINEELTYFQKIILVIQLIEFLNSGSGISELEHGFVLNVSQTLNIRDDEFRLLYDFIVLPLEKTPLCDQLLIISENEQRAAQGRFLMWDDIEAEVHVLYLESLPLLLMRCSRDANLTLNGQLVSADTVHVLHPGSSIRSRRSDPLFYSDIISCFLSCVSEQPFTFEVDDLSYIFRKGNVGLHPMSFAARSGRLVGVIGDSGAGKTTLINLLCGIYKPSGGSVSINGIDMHRHPDKVKGLVGLVSQDDLLMEDLTVYQNLYYNARLCFGDWSEDQIQDRVVTLLRSLGLYEVRQMKVGSPLFKNISGGQRKRLNIALELIREPAILFLDEPTSGLSSRDSENVIDLLKELTIKGKLIFVVIHQPSSTVFKLFDQLLVLDTGGYLIYNGEPVESITYFKAGVNHAGRDANECPACGNVNAEQILNIVNTHVVDEYGNLTSRRRINPVEWYERHQYTQSLAGRAVQVEKAELPAVNFKVPGRLRQFFVFTSRDLLSKLRNPSYWFINLLQAPVLAVLLASLLRYYNVDEAFNRGYVFADNPNLVVYLVIAVIISLFAGLTLSAEEIISDRKILNRESFLQLSWLSYLFSKVVIIGTISAIQTALFVWIGNGIMQVHQMFFPYWLVLFSAAVFANLLGLIISDSLSKTVNIYIIIPFLIIPQLILSGVFVGYDRFNPHYASPDDIPWYGELVTARWAFEALAVHQYSANAYQKPFFELEQQKSRAMFMKDYWSPAMFAKIEAAKIAHGQGDDAKVHQLLHVFASEFDRQAVLGHEPMMVRLMKPRYNDSIDHFLRSTIDTLRIYYRQQYNDADRQLDLMRNQQIETMGREEYLLLRDRCYNDALDRFMRNTNQMLADKIIEYHGRFIQKVDPVYRKSSHPYLLAHFLASSKNFGRYQIPTLWANVMVIWAFNIILFVFLYFRLVSRLMEIWALLKHRTWKKFEEGDEGGDGG
ncbi:MAG: ATP-binding cassette domain-containing protein [Marinilabiliaceae bacterium]|nr:ATP-binding cassette domain-containing protein [Marinilabiliaceae bacterium]